MMFLVRLNLKVGFAPTHIAGLFQRKACAIKLMYRDELAVMTLVYLL